MLALDRPSEEGFAYGCLLFIGRAARIRSVENDIKAGNMHTKRSVTIQV